jgi:hypothetical protein
VASRAVGRFARRALQRDNFHYAENTLAVFSRQSEVGEGSAGSGCSGYPRIGVCETWFARWHRRNPTHLQRSFRVQFHGHTMVTAGGLCGVTSKWVASVYYDDLQLMKSWRRVVVRLLRTALQAGQLRSTMCAEQVEALFFEQEKCSWIIKVQTIHSKEHFLKYAGRYVRRPPIAQRRITYIGQGLVRFWAKDKKMGCVVPVECTLGEFLDRWAQHIREHYQHAVRNFGLFSPRALKHTSAAILAILGQIPKSRPKPIPWAVSLKRDFGRDPLLLPDGKRMTWVRRLAPKAAS